MRLVINTPFFNVMLCSQKIKEEVTSPKTTKRVRESPAKDHDEPEKVTPKRAKTQVRGSVLHQLLVRHTQVHWLWGFENRQYKISAVK